MKKAIISLNFIFGAVALYAQSPEQGFQQLYYERYQSAENTFQQVLKQNPNNAEAWLGLTRAYVLQDQPAKAAEQIRLAPASVQNNPLYEAAYGTALLNNNKKDSAAILFQKALDQTKEKNATVLAAIAQAHIDSKNGDANYAVDLLNKAIKRDKHNEALFTALGDAWLKLNKGSEAYKAYEEAIKENNKYAAAHHKLGVIFLSQKNTELFLQHFTKAIAADADYAPSLYKLYTHYFYYDPAKALQYYKDYASKSDHSIQNEYELADLLYVNKSYNDAIQKAKNIIATEGQNAKPRLYKLIAYSFADQKDSAQALTYMKQYFSSEEDSNFVAKDFEAMASFFLHAGNSDSSIAYYQKAVETEKDSAALYKFYKQLADISKSLKDYAAQAEWLEKYYKGNNEANNIDLFNWGVASYLAQNYPMADSAFSIYTEKYPEQAYGYYWRARSNIAIDTAMTEGLAIPHYQKLVEVLQKDSSNANYKKWMSEAYGYLAAYEANTQKDYAEAIDYFEKVLDVDPANENARRYISMLEKNLEGSK
jgi:tetratricopeptide (TPR) repeat protein